MSRKQGQCYLRTTREACIKMSSNPVNPKAAKHIDTWMYHIRELVQDRIIWSEKTPTELNVADELTKSLAAQAFHMHLQYLQGCLIPFPLDCKYLQQHPDIVAALPEVSGSRHATSGGQAQAWSTVVSKSNPGSLTPMT